MLLLLVYNFYLKRKESTLWAKIFKDFETYEQRHPHDCLEEVYRLDHGLYRRRQCAPFHRVPMEFYEDDVLVILLIQVKLGNC
jgi:hypothetical protein